MPYTDAFTEENNPFQKKPPVASSSSNNTGDDVFGAPSSAATPRRRSLFTSDGFSPAKRSSSKPNSTPQRFSMSSSNSSQASAPLFTSSSSSSTTQTSTSPTRPEPLIEEHLSFSQSSFPSASTSRRKSSGGFPKQPPAAAQDAHMRIDKLEAQLKDFQASNARLVAELEAQHHRASEQERVQQTQQSHDLPSTPVSSAAAPPMTPRTGGFAKMAANEKRLYRCERELKDAIQSKETLFHEIRLLRSEGTEKDQMAEALRDELRTSTEHGHGLHQQIKELEHSLHSRESEDYVSAQKHADKVNNMQASLDAGQAQQDKLAQQLDDAHARRTDEVNTLKRELSSVKDAHHELNVAHSRLEAKLREKEVALAAAQASLNYQRSIQKASDDAVKDLKKTMTELEQSKKGLAQKLSSARGDTERLSHERSIYVKQVAQLENELKDCKREKEVLHREQAKRPSPTKPPSNLGTNPSTPVDVKEKSRAALAAQKGSKPLQALFHWAVVLADLQAADDEDELHVKCLYNRASLLMDFHVKNAENERLAFAQGDCAAIFRMQPGHYKAHRLQGNLYRRAKEFEAAIKSYNTALRLAHAEDTTGAPLTAFIASVEGDIKLTRELIDKTRADEERKKEDKLNKEFQQWRRDKRNDWEVLGLPKGSTRAQINNAAKVLASKFHPDKPTGNTKIMQRIFEARDRLSK